MKKLFLMLLVMAVSSSASAFNIIPVMVAIGDSYSDRASDGTLDGTKFCRTVQRDGSFGQPRGPAKHCVTFKNGKMTNNANTFFGNPPSTKPYRIKGDDVQVKEGKRWKTVYTIEENTLVNDAHVLVLEE